MSTYITCYKEQTHEMEDEEDKSIESILIQFKHELVKEVSGHERLSACRAYVQHVLETVPDGIGTTADNVKETVRLLIRAALDKKFASSGSLTNYLGEDDVKKMIKRLAEGESDGMDILQWVQLLNLYPYMSLQIYIYHCMAIFQAMVISYHKAHLFNIFLWILTF